MSLFTSFVNNYQKLVDLEFVTKEMVLNYNVSNKRNFHSKLIYIFMKSAEENDYIAIPEIKIKYTKQPLNPKNYGITGKQQHQYKTDVALYKNRKLNGICEVFSFDMVANYLTMVERDNIHNLGKFTSTDKIIHLINNNLENEVDLYIIGVLPNNY